MTDLRAVRLRAGFTQEDLARLLGVPVNTLRMWDSGLRPTLAYVVARVTRLLEAHARDTEVLRLHALAVEFGMHVRTLQAAARTGRLQTQFSTRSVFGRPMRFATRAAVRTFREEHYRRFQGQQVCPVPLPVVSADYDTQIRQLRLRLGLTLGQFAARIGAANTAVIYQWESRKRAPSPVFWLAIDAVLNAPYRRRYEPWPQARARAHGFAWLVQESHHGVRKPRPSPLGRRRYAMFFRTCRTRTSWMSVCPPIPRRQASSKDRVRTFADRCTLPAWSSSGRRGDSTECCRSRRACQVSQRPPSGTGT